MFSMTGNIVNGKELLEALSAPFPPQDIEWKVQSASKRNNATNLLVVPYIESRAVMNRLDCVCGLDWQSRFNKIEVGGKEAFQCELSVKINGEWITRTDAAEVSDYESVKGGHSNALKRAAVQFGIGRSLYDLPQFWVELKQRGEHRVWGKFKINGQMEQVSGYFDTPALPDWALPTGSKQPKPNKQNSKNESHSKNNNNTEQQDAIHHVKTLLQLLNIPMKFVKGLLERCGSKAGDLEKASVNELRSLYQVLSPVERYVSTCRNLRLGTEQMIYYAQIVLKVHLESLHSLYFKMDSATADEAIELAKADMQQAV